MSANDNRSEDARIWGEVERHRRVDRLVGYVTTGAWTATIAVVTAFAVLTSFGVYEQFRVREDWFKWSFVVESVTPLFVVLGLLGGLVGTLGTVTIVLRRRTASLLEIQQRLASLEELLASRADEGENKHPR